jgi:hypothetical protein
MKIALCFSGQPRSLEQGYVFYKHYLLDHYDVDVYLHSHASNDPKVSELYNPVGCVFSEFDAGNANQHYTNTPNAIKHPPSATKSMFSSMFQCRNMIKGEYDWVIRTRTDFALNIKIPFETLDKEKIYLPIDGNDQFAFGSQDNMMLYMNTYENIDSYYDNGTEYIGEAMMRANFTHYGLWDKIVKYDLNFPFMPGPFNGTPHALIRNDRLQWK